MGQGMGPRDSAHPVLTAEGVPAPRGWVGTGPGPVQTLLQPPLGLPELVLVQWPGRQGLPGLQSESTLASPGGGRAVRREGWASEDALPAPGSQPHRPQPTSRRCSIHSAHSSHQRSPRRRNRSPRPPARCPGAPSRRLRFHLQAQTGGRRLSAPPWGWPGSLPPPPGLAWAPGLTAHPWDGQGLSPGTRPAQGLPSAVAPWSPHCFAGSHPRCRMMT